MLVIKEIKIPTKYSDFSNIFLKKKALILLEGTKLNQCAIKLQKGQQLLYGPIYSLCLIEFVILKTYIKTNLANSFIYSLKLFAGASILFVGKLSSSFYLYKNYWGLNNLTIKNQYLPPFIGKLLDQLGRAKRFT